MNSEFVINIDIIKLLTGIFTVVGLAIAGMRYTSDKFGRIDERLKYLEKRYDELKMDLRELSKNDHANT